MVRITEELLKKRAEHNDGILSTLEEVTLHQYNIEKIELLGTRCKHLKILYLQNNLIEKMENLYKLKELEYLNLALNNISKIEGLATCESINKLDLTLNFIDIDTFEESINNLKQNRCLADLNLTGNPCTDHAEYRLFVIHSLPQLSKLDSVQIKKSEIIKAKQSFNSLSAAIRLKADKKRNEKSAEPEAETDKKYQNIEYEHSVKGRKAAYMKERDREEKEKDDDAKKKEENPFKMPADIIKETKQKMCVIEKEGPNGELPKQRNIGRYEFTTEGADDIYEENLRVIVEAPKYLDTSEIFVDINPLWFQVIIKKKSLLLHLPVEVKVTECRVRRVMCNGWLELIMPKLIFKQRPKKKKESKKESEKKQADVEEKEQVFGNNEDVLEPNDEESDFDEDEVPPLE